MKKKIYWSIGINVTALIGVAAIWFHDTGSKTSQFTGPASPEEPVPQELVASLETYGLELMEEYDVPGAAAMVLVKGNQVVYARGLGVTDLVTQSPVTTRTLFGISSSTNPMTSIMVASLVDDDVIAWDTPVHKILPAFAMLIRRVDLVHQTGRMATYRLLEMLTCGEQVYPIPVLRGGIPRPLSRAALGLVSRLGIGATAGTICLTCVLMVMAEVIDVFRLTLKRTPQDLPRQGNAGPET